MVKPRYMLNVFNVFNTVLRMMLARGWRFASGKGGKSRAGHKGGKGDTGLHLPPSLLLLFFFFFAPSRPCCASLRPSQDRPRTGSAEPQSSVGDRTSEMRVQAPVRDVCTDY